MSGRMPARPSERPDRQLNAHTRDRMHLVRTQVCTHVRMYVYRYVCIQGCMYPHIYVCEYYSCYYIISSSSSSIFHVVDPSRSLASHNTRCIFMFNASLMSCVRLLLNNPCLFFREPWHGLLFSVSHSYLQSI